MQNKWMIKTVSLDYFFGEICLLKKNILLKVLDKHFTELPNNPNISQFTSELLCNGVEGILIRSHPTSSPLPTLKLIGQIIQYAPNQYLRYYTDLSLSFSDYLKKFSSKSRSTILRKIRKFKAFSGGKILWHTFQEPETIKEFYSFARQVSKKTYQEKLLNMGFPSSSEFLTQLVELASAGSMKGYILFYGHNPIAYLYCTIRNGILFYDYLGYDPEFSSWSPGVVLQYLVLEKLFIEGGYRMFDFTEGEGRHKKTFATGSVRCADIYFFPANLRNSCILLTHFLITTISKKTAFFFDILGIKNLIKKLIRSHV